MGIEYQLRFMPANAESVEADLRRLPFDVRNSSIPGQIEIRTDAISDWPDATVRIEADGVYFCDHLTGLGPTVLGVVIAKLTAAFGPITIEEL